MFKENFKMAEREIKYRDTIIENQEKEIALLKKIIVKLTDEMVRRNKNE